MYGGHDGELRAELNKARLQHLQCILHNGHMTMWYPGKAMHKLSSRIHMLHTLQSALHAKKFQYDALCNIKCTVAHNGCITVASD